MKLSADFYLQKDVVAIAKKLIGKVLVTNSNNQLTSGIITETEAYEGVIDKASHAYNNLRTARTETMYNKGGYSYVYLCYGIHYLFNVVTNSKDIPHAVLIRGVQPLEGLKIMNERRNLPITSCILKNYQGPGKVSQALGITKAHNNISLLENQIWIEDRGIKIEPKKIKATPRIGVAYAQDHALWPYRFVVEEKLV